MTKRAVFLPFAATIPGAAWRAAQPQIAPMSIDDEFRLEQFGRI